MMCIEVSLRGMFEGTLPEAQVVLRAAMYHDACVFHLGHFLLAALQGTLCPSSGLEMEA
jgi:hypothetical protein